MMTSDILFFKILINSERFEKEDQIEIACNKNGIEHEKISAQYKVIKLTFLIQRTMLKSLEI